MPETIADATGNEDELVQTDNSGEAGMPEENQDPNHNPQEDQ